MTSHEIKRQMAGEVKESVQECIREGRWLSAIFCILWFTFSHFEVDDTAVSDAVNIEDNLF